MNISKSAAVHLNLCIKTTACPDLPST
uniref:Uncharacterized protein n=1 Tax=Anguilla anguilla TaxID=7936 RepID=A0A0E9R8D4_ANGAN